MRFLYTRFGDRAREFVRRAEMSDYSTCYMSWPMIERFQDAGTARTRCMSHSCWKALARVIDHNFAAVYAWCLYLTEESDAGTPGRYLFRNRRRSPAPCTNIWLVYAAKLRETLRRTKPAPRAYSSRATRSAEKWSSFTPTTTGETRTDETTVKAWYRRSFLFFLLHNR